jgi:hypothetical protein
MTQASTIRFASTPATARLRRLLAGTCAAAFLAVGLAATPAFAQGAPVVDASKLPRPASVRILAALPESTIFLAAEPVSEAAKAALKQLEAGGWTRYVSPRSQPANSATSETHYLKKGGQGLTLFVQVAPAQGNATSVSYIPMPLSRDLPFPVGGTDIRFSPEPFHLDATTTLAREALLAFYRTELSKAGWSLHSSSDGSAPKTIPAEAGTEIAFFTHGAMGALHVVTRTKDAGSTVAIRSVPASLLPGAQVARAPEPAAPPKAPTPSPAHAQMSQMMDTMAQDLMKQALQPPKAQGLDAAMAAARSAGVIIPTPGRAQPAAAPSVASAPAPEPALERDEFGGLPVPKSASQKSREKTPYRLEVRATVRSSSSSVLDFYRQELGGMGWREAGPVRNEGDRTVLSFTSPDGPAVLTLERKGREVSIAVLQRKEAELRKAGLMPKAGQAKIMFGSMMDGDATVLVGGRTFKLPPGTGSKAPDGPSLDVAPGAHKVTIKSAGKPDVVEVVTVRADDVWGVLLGPGGALPLPLY